LTIPLPAIVPLQNNRFIFLPIFSPNRADNEVPLSPPAATAETVADLYKGKTPLPRVPNYQEPFASRHPNTWNARANQYLEQSPETHNHRIHSFPPIATE
jgi:hypothetical protein